MITYSKHYCYFYIIITLLCLLFQEAGLSNLVQEFETTDLFREKIRENKIGQIFEREKPQWPNSQTTTR